MFLYYKLTHGYIFDDRCERKEIGIFSSKEKANKTIDQLKTKPGFLEYPDGFSIKKCFRLFRPFLSDQIFWSDGFDPSSIHTQTTELCCDKETYLMQHFSFLLTEYGFQFQKRDLGDMIDENGKLWCYGPYNCYCFFTDTVCINFLNLVQRQDWSVYITKELLMDQNLIHKGVKVPGDLCYHPSSLASVIKEELARSSSVFSISIH